MKRYIVIGIAILMLGIGFAPPASAVIVTLEFDGTYDITGSTVFGESGLDTPYHYSLEYDTALNTSTDVFLTGAEMIPSADAGHDWYGYSSSGIISFDFTFGTKTFTMEDIAPEDLGWGPTSDLWFDVAIGTSTPSRAFFVMEDGDGKIMIGIPGIGSVFSSRPQIVMTNVSIINDDSGMLVGIASSSDLTISQSQAPIPEPATVALLGIGLVGLAGAEVRRRRKKKAVS